MTGGLPESHLFVDQDMGEGLPIPLGVGRAVVYSARAPAKEGPNEDAAAVIRVAASAGILAIADGLGGQPAGARAAEQVVRRLEQEAVRAEADEGSLRRAVLDALDAANQALLESGAGAATTCAAVALVAGGLRPYHVGDSAILVVGQRGRIKLQTVAHSPVGYAVESGLLGEEDALHHEERHLISNVVGATDMRIELGSPLRLAARDTVLLATDGLFDNLLLDEIVERIRAGPVAVAAARLVRLATERMRRPVAGSPSKPDDLTFILYRGSGSPRRSRKGPKNPPAGASA